MKHVADPTLALWFAFHFENQMKHMHALFDIFSLDEKSIFDPSLSKSVDPLELTLCTHTHMHKRSREYMHVGIKTHRCGTDTPTRTPPQQMQVNADMALFDIFSVDDLSIFDPSLSKHVDLLELTPHSSIESHGAISAITGHGSGASTPVNR